MDRGEEKRHDGQEKREIAARVQVPFDRVAERERIKSRDDTECI
jgi:hypothetical protein